MGADAPDEYFAKPYVDLDEWRDVPVRHRYVHGGFAGTETRFSAYFPTPARYEGRFFQHITPVPDSEHLAQAEPADRSKIASSSASGAYFLETNGGGGPAAGPGGSVDPTIGAYRANAAAAQYSRILAAEMYGEHRTFGYAYGGSGGGFRTIGGAENTVGVWDGFVPYVIGSPMAIPNMFTIRMHAQRVLRFKLDQIVDAVEPGGSGDPYLGLDDEERAALLEVTRMGFPPRSWFGHRTMGMHAFPLLYQGMAMADPSYFEDFWTEPGYLGYELPPSLQRDRVQLETTVAATISEREAQALGLTIGPQPGKSHGTVDTAWLGTGAESAVPVAIRLSSAPDVDVMGADLIVNSGVAAGAKLILLSVTGDLAVLFEGDATVLSKLRPGDAIRVDNSGFLAAQTYHRHQVPGPDFYVWDQFREPDGTPSYPQRPLILGPLFAAAAAGTVQSGAFQGKMIVVESLLDREALPWQADWYRSRVVENLGAATDDHLRVWFTDNALHGDDADQEYPTHTISYLGVLQQALRDLSAWVEQGITPPANTSYELVEGQVVVPDTAAVRGGVQPVVSLQANGGLRADVTAGESVDFTGLVEVPPGTGTVVAGEWDFDGSGDFAVAADDIDGSSPRVSLRASHAFSEPGTYFVTLRAASERQGDTASSFARIPNLARVRVVVTRGQAQP